MLPRRPPNGYLAERPGMGLVEGHQGTHWYLDMRTGELLTRAQFRELPPADRFRISLDNPPAFCGHVVNWDVVESGVQRAREAMTPSARESHAKVAEYLRRKGSE